MNLTLNLELLQEKEILVLLKNVKVIWIKNSMLLNELNKKKDKLIFKNYKQDNKYKILIMSLNIRIFIFGLIREIVMILSLM